MPTLPVLLGMFVNLMMSMVKQFLPTEMTERFQFGCMFNDRLDKTFLVPDKTSAKARNYARIIEALTIRYENEATFRL